jgi:hypothetical protein
MYTDNAAISFRVSLVRGITECGITIRPAITSTDWPGLFAMETKLGASTSIESSPALAANYVTRGAQSLCMRKSQFWVGRFLPRSFVNWKQKQRGHQ